MPSNPYNPTFSQADANIFLQNAQGGSSPSGNTPMYQNQDVVNKYMNDNGWGGMEYDNGGNPYTIYSNLQNKPLLKDSALEANLKKAGGIASVKVGPDGKPDRGSLSNPNHVWYDPTFGWVTYPNNSKPRTEESQVGKAMSQYVMPMVLGMANPMAGMAFGMGKSAISGLSGQQPWSSVLRGMIPSIVGAGLGMAGVPSNIGNLAKMGSGFVMNSMNQRRR